MAPALQLPLGLAIAVGFAACGRPLSTPQRTVTTRAAFPGPRVPRLPVAMKSQTSSRAPGAPPHLEHAVATRSAVQRGPTQLEPAVLRTNRLGLAAPSSAVARDPQPPPVTPQAGPDEAALWRQGQQIDVIARKDAEATGMLLLDVGTRWMPALFRSAPDAPHTYGHVFADLANARFDDSPEGHRARRDRYLEVYGISPSPALLAERYAAMRGRACIAGLSLGALRAFEGVTWTDDNRPHVSVQQPVIDAVQTRLRCEGHLRRPPSGRLDSPTRYAIEEFERRNRIYGRGHLQGPTLAALASPPLELERRALLRTLTERVVLELGMIEDGSATGVAPASETAAPQALPAPNLVAALKQRIRQSLGLDTLTGLRRFYDALGAFAPDGSIPAADGALSKDHYYLAIDPIPLPDYYGPQMDLFVEVDRGDIYYEFPLDAQGQARDLARDRRPALSLFSRAGDQVLWLARYPTTVGGWRIEHQDGQDVWQYKESPVGPRVWAHIVSAPVWLPPAATPPETLVLPIEHGSDDAAYRIHHNLIGPSYASAYGLFAAYHRMYEQTKRGAIVLGHDEGIRSHGTSEYTSPWGGVSLGCHRLPNHLALRLFSFILAHRTHVRAGHQPVNFRRTIEYEGFEDTIRVKRTGYVFELQPPLPVEVLSGRIVGELAAPPPEPIPTDALPTGLVGPELAEEPPGTTASTTTSPTEPPGDAAAPSADSAENAPGALPAM